MKKQAFSLSCLNLCQVTVAEYDGPRRVAVYSNRHLIQSFVPTFVRHQSAQFTGHIDTCYGNCSRIASPPIIRQLADETLADSDGLETVAWLWAEEEQLAVEGDLGAVGSEGIFSLLLMCSMRRVVEKLIPTRAFRSWKIIRSA